MFYQDRLGTSTGKAQNKTPFTQDEWAASAQGQALQPLQPVEVLRIDDGSSTPEPLSSDPARPLSGVKVLDLTHVLAGCVGSRTLAEHGATVLHVRPRLYYEKHYGSPEATDAGFVQVRNPIKQSSSVSPDKTIINCVSR